MKKLNWYKFDVMAWRTSETRGRCLALGGVDGLAAMAVYRELVDLCNCQGHIPSDLGGLAAAAGCTVDVIKLVWPVIGHKFKPTKDPKKLTQRNATAELRRAQEFSRLQSERAAARYKDSAGIPKDKIPKNNPAAIRQPSGKPDLCRNPAISDVADVSHRNASNGTNGTNGHAADEESLAWCEAVYDNHPTPGRRDESLLALRERFWTCSDAAANRKLWEANYPKWLASERWQERGRKFVPLLVNVVIDGTWKKPPPFDDPMAGVGDYLKEHPL